MSELAKASFEAFKPIEKEAEAMGKTALEIRNLHHAHNAGFMDGADFVRQRIVKEFEERIKHYDSLPNRQGVDFVRAFGEAIDTVKGEI